MSRVSAIRCYDEYDDPYYAAYAGRLHLPTAAYPWNWTPADDSQVWQSKAFSFQRAVEAWEAAASSQAGPLQPPHIRALALQCHSCEGEEPNAAQLVEICDEAYRRACWLPSGYRHPVAPASAEVWRHRLHYGLLWESSVQTILARTAAGWTVRIIGGHLRRQEAAERVLGV